MPAASQAEQRLPPFLGLPDLVEREDVQPFHRRGRVGQRGPRAVQQPLGAVPTRGPEPQEPFRVPGQEPGRLRHPGFRGHRGQPGPLDRTARPTYSGSVTPRARTRLIHSFSVPGSKHRLLTR